MINFVSKHEEDMWWTVGGDVGIRLAKMKATILQCLITPTAATEGSTGKKQAYMFFKTIKA